MEDKDYEKYMVTWKKAWVYRTFRSRTIIGLISLIAVLLFYPFFFNIIEERKGIIEINDIILNVVPAIDLSIPIFVIIYSVTIFVLYQCYKDPSVFIIYLWSFIIMSLLRIICISMVPLEAPEQLIAIKDPISNTFYAGRYITKDLFFSGHTATQFLMFLCLKKKKERTVVLICSILIGIMVLVQHVHYTIDVLAAPLFAYVSYWLTKTFLVHT
jgi:membrane-associated phospholipid phosphatase